MKQMVESTQNEIHSKIQKINQILETSTDFETATQLARLMRFLKNVKRCNGC
jgi:hypothetical protein